VNPVWVESNRTSRHKKCCRFQHRILCTLPQVGKKKGGEMAWTRESIIALAALFATFAPIAVLLIQQRQNRLRIGKCISGVTCARHGYADANVEDADAERGSQPAYQPLRTASQPEIPRSSCHTAQLLCAQIAFQLVVLPGGHVDATHHQR